MNRFNLSWGEKFNTAWEVFLTIWAWVCIAFYILSALFGIGVFFYFLFSGKLF